MILGASQLITQKHRYPTSSSTFAEHPHTNRVSSLPPVSQPLLTRPLLKASLFSPRASSADARVKSASPPMGKYSLSIFLDAIMASAWKGGHRLSEEGITMETMMDSSRSLLCTFACSKGAKIGLQEFLCGAHSKQGAAVNISDKTLQPPEPTVGDSVGTMEPRKPGTRRKHHFQPVTSQCCCTRTHMSLNKQELS